MSDTRPGPIKIYISYTHAKAVVASLVSGVIALLSSLITALQGENTGFETITDGQWLTACLAFFVGLGVTHGATSYAKNKDVPASDAEMTGT